MFIFRYFASDLWSFGFSICNSHRTAQWSETYSIVTTDDDTVLQTQDSKFEPWRSEAEHATSRSRRLPTILTFTRAWGRNIFVSFKPPRPGTEPRTLAWKATVLTTALGPPPHYTRYYFIYYNCTWFDIKRIHAVPAARSLKFVNFHFSLPALLE